MTDCDANYHRSILRITTACSALQMVSDATIEICIVLKADDDHDADDDKDGDCDEDYNGSFLFITTNRDIYYHRSIPSSLAT